MPVGRLLEAIRYGEQFALGKVITDDLQADGKWSFGTESTWNRHGRQSGQADAQGINVRQPICDWIFAVVTDCVRNGGRYRAHNDVAFIGKRMAEVVGNHASDFLRLYVIRIVIAMAQHIGAD